MINEYLKVSEIHTVGTTWYIKSFFPHTLPLNYWSLHSSPSMRISYYEILKILKEDWRNAQTAEECVVVKNLQRKFRRKSINLHWDLQDNVWINRTTVDGLAWRTSMVGGTTERAIPAFERDDKNRSTNGNDGRAKGCVL